MKWLDETSDPDRRNLVRLFIASGIVVVLLLSGEWLMGGQEPAPSRPPAPAGPNERDGLEPLDDRTEQRAAALARASRSTPRPQPEPAAQPPRVASPEPTARPTVKPSAAPLVGWRGVYWRKGQAWAAQPKTRAVIKCESGDRPTARSATGKYRGLYQMDADAWASYGGLPLAASPDRASREAQNYVAFRLYSGRGWAPWTCA